MPVTSSINSRVFFFNFSPSCLILFLEVILSSCSFKDFLSVATRNTYRQDFGAKKYLDDGITIPIYYFYIFLD